MPIISSGERFRLTRKTKHATIAAKIASAPVAPMAAPMPILAPLLRPPLRPSCEPRPAAEDDEGFEVATAGVVELVGVRVFRRCVLVLCEVVAEVAVEAVPREVLEDAWGIEEVVGVDVVLLERVVLVLLGVTIAVVAGLPFSDAIWVRTPGAAALKVNWLAVPLQPSSPQQFHSLVLSEYCTYGLVK